MSQQIRSAAVILSFALAAAGPTAAAATRSTAPLECVTADGPSVTAETASAVPLAPAEEVALSFREPQPLDALAAWAERAGVGALDVRVEGTVEVGGEELYESLTLGSHEPGLRLADAGSVRGELARLRRVHFRDALTVRPPFGERYERSLEPLERGMREALENGRVPTGLAVRRLFVQPSGDAVGALLEESFAHLEAVESRSLACRRPTAPAVGRGADVPAVAARTQPPAPRAVRPADTPHARGGVCVPPPDYAGSWQPNCGYQWVAPAGDGQRDGIVHFLLWWRPTFSGNATYEHDYWVDATDGLYLHDVASTPYPDCMPVIKYWVVTYPPASRPYLDTRFDVTRCEDTLVPFTIGIADATQVVGGKIYSVRVYPYPGNAEIDSAELVAQRGHRSPPFCYSTWCVFADETDSIIPGIYPPGFEWSVPGSETWSWEW